MTKLYKIAQFLQFIFEQDIKNKLTKEMTMENEQKLRDPQTSKIAMDLHLAKFNYFMAKKDWKSAVMELQQALNAVIEILDHANKTLRKISEKYQQTKPVATTEPTETSAITKIEGSIRTERISDDTVLVEYPGNKIVLKKI